MYKVIVLLFFTGVVISQREIGGKNGDCPPPTDIQVCTESCSSDYECAGTQKCCPTSCGGTVCNKPIPARKETHKRVKIGNCPQPSGPWVCSHTCEYDGDCRGRLKCCPNRCGAKVCTKPDPLATF